MKNIYNNRFFWLIIALLNIGAVAIAYGLQIELDLKPCFLCIIQRIACLIVAIGAFLIFLKPIKSKMKLFGLSITILGLASGIAAAIRHIYVQANPSFSFSCGPGAEYIMKNNSLMDAIPKLFKATGDCQTIDWTYLGLTIPQISLIFFLCICLLLISSKVISCMKK